MAIPPWIAQRAAPNPAEAYIQSLHVGAQLGMEASRLQQQRELAEQEMSARAAEQEQRHLREQQQIEYDKAYKDAELGMQQQRIDEAKQLTDQKIAETANRFAAQQRVNAAIASGVSPEVAMFKEAANLDLGAGDIGALLRANHPAPSITGGLMDIGGGYKTFQTGPNTRKLIRPEDVPGAVQAQPVLDPTTKQPMPGYSMVGKTLVRPQKQSSGDNLAAQSAKLHRQVVAKQRAALQKILDNDALFQTAYERMLQKDPKLKADDYRSQVEKKIEQLDADYEKTPNGEDPGAPVDLIYDRKTKKFSKPSASVADGEATANLADASESDPEADDSEDA